MNGNGHRKRMKSGCIYVYNINPGHRLPDCCRPLEDYSQFVSAFPAGYNYNLLIAGAFDQMSTVPKPVLYLILAGSGVGPLWYIQMLWIFEVILLLVRKIEKDRLYHICDKTPCIILWLFIFLIYGAAQVLNTPFIVVYRFGIYGAGFFIGYFVMSHDYVMERLEKPGTT